MRILTLAIGLILASGAQAEILTYQLRGFASSFGAVTDNSGTTNYNYQFVDRDNSMRVHILSFVEEPQLNSDRMLKALTNSAFQHGIGIRATKATLYINCQSQPFCWDEKGKEYCSYVLKNSATGSHPSNCALTQFYVGEFK